jgi:hypothetical protein
MLPSAPQPTPGRPVTTTTRAPRQRIGGGSGSTIRVLVAVESMRELALFAALQSAAPVVGGAFGVTWRCTTAEALEAGVLAPMTIGSLFSYRYRGETHYAGHAG